MGGTIKTTYKGWDITIRCLKFRARANIRGNSDSFTASGRAVLQHCATDGDWIDARTQVLTLHGQVFNTAAGCAHVLLAQMTVRLDALKRRQPRPAAA